MEMGCWEEFIFVAQCGIMRELGEILLRKIYPRRRLDKENMFSLSSLLGDSPSGKALGSGPSIRGFESLIPSQALWNSVILWGLVLVLSYWTELSFIIFNFRDVLIANARGWVNAAGVEFNTDILDLVGRKWWAWADDIV